MTRSASFMFCAVLSAAILTVGCNSSIGPDGGGLLFSYSPEGTAVALPVGGRQEFRVLADGAGAFSVDWTLDGIVISQATTYVFQADQAGHHTLRVNVTYAGGGELHQWDLNVTSDQPELPPVVPDVALADVPGEPGAVRASWSGVKAGTYPVVEYVLAAGNGGAIDEVRWEQTAIKVSVPATGQLSYSRQLDGGDGVVPGQVLWIAVRARDDHGNLSPLGAGVSYPVSFPWYLTGTVSNDSGDPLGNTILKFRTSLALRSGAASGDGSFREGPFSSTDSVQVSALALDAGIYTWRSSYLGFAAGESPLDIVLIRKYGADATCSANGGDFLSYLRFMTRTDINEGSSILHKWDQYPVKVFIPEFQRDDGVDFDTLCVSALQYWNDTVAPDLLVRVDQASAADVMVEFRTGMSQHGLVEMTDPEGELGSATPRQMHLMVDAEMTAGGEIQIDAVVKGVCLHEFGHVLGLYDHSHCDGYALMEVGGGPNAFSSGVSSPLSTDEYNAVRCLRHLSDGLDMSGYDFDSLAR